MTAATFTDRKARKKRRTNASTATTTTTKPSVPRKKKPRRKNPMPTNTTRRRRSRDTSARPRCLGLRCPDPACHAAVARELVDDVAHDADKAQYANFALRSYVEDSGGRVKWCPGADCTRAVQLNGSGARAHAADVFCVQPLLDAGGARPHRQAATKLIMIKRRTTMVYMSDDNDDDGYVSETKADAFEEHDHIDEERYRTGGVAVAWRRTGAWCAPSASRATPRAARPTTTASPAGAGTSARRRQAKASLDRYLYHYERWAANKSSLQKVLKDMAELEKSGLQKMVGRPATELAFVAAAYEQIAAGRRVLRWAHAYGYYLDPACDGAKRALFEDLLDQANECLERLHGSYATGGVCGNVVEKGEVNSDSFNAFIEMAILSEYLHVEEMLELTHLASVMQLWSYYQQNLD
ncbi:hypothetical protein PR202_ga22709 [Eleusine coracana subsp. coracana]|uniref:Uncharacterized protein n=1 Tax=Eleusine coracana subsp. coracana TaxID=191504 RepID=A0AAV5D490_ELECO|nr:hypothetical protein PR202_ga22709 [Eleusine coracana subsp. coracana]